MDKHLYKKNTLRNGFALLLTLSILSIVIVLTSVLVSYLSKVHNDSADTKALIQANIYYDDIQKVLKKYSSHKTELYETLYETPLPIVVPKSDFSLLIKCEPIANGININWIKFATKPKFKKQYRLYREVIDNISMLYNIVDINLLEELILFKINNHNKRLKSKPFILSYSELRDVLFSYISKTKDKSVLKVPWDKYFVFNQTAKNPDDNIIDANYMTPELIALVFNLDIAFVNENWSKGDNLYTFLSENGVEYDKKLFYSKFYLYSRCFIRYLYMNNNYSFSFDDIQGEVKNFEFFGKE